MASPLSQPDRPSPSHLPEKPLQSLLNAGQLSPGIETRGADGRPIPKREEISSASHIHHANERHESPSVYPPAKASVSEAPPPERVATVNGEANNDWEEVLAAKDAAIEKEREAFVEERKAWKQQVELLTNSNKQLKKDHAKLEEEMAKFHQERKSWQQEKYDLQVATSILKSQGSGMVSPAVGAIDRGNPFDHIGHLPGILSRHGSDQMHPSRENSLEEAFKKAKSKTNIEAILEHEAVVSPKAKPEQPKAAGPESTTGLLSPTITVDDVNDDRSDATSLTPGTLLAQEEPFSPPPTGMVLSPPPAHYVRHAGHTPMKPSDSVVISQLPTSGARSPVGGLPAEDPFLAAKAAEDGDVALRSPLGLADERGADAINQLQSKLNAIADDPEKGKPAALLAPGNLAARNLSSDSVAVTTNSDTSARDPAPLNGGKHPEEKSEEPEIKLKLKKSMNFGQPWGAA